MHESERNLAKQLTYNYFERIVDEKKAAYTHTAHMIVQTSRDSQHQHPVRGCRMEIDGP